MNYPTQVLLDVMEVHYIPWMTSVHTTNFKGDQPLVRKLTSPALLARRHLSLYFLSPLLRSGLAGSGPLGPQSHWRNPFVLWERERATLCNLLQIQLLLVTTALKHAVKLWTTLLAIGVWFCGLAQILNHTFLIDMLTRHTACYIKTWTVHLQYLTIWECSVLCGLPEPVRSCCSRVRSLSWLSRRSKRWA